MRLQVFPDNVFVVPSHVASTASPDRQESEVRSSARLNGHKALERLPNLREWVLRGEGKT